jgi:hypothetical protein
MVDEMYEGEAEELDRDIETLELRLSLAENGIEEASAVLGLKPASGDSAFSTDSGSTGTEQKPVKRTVRLWRFTIPTKYPYRVFAYMSLTLGILGRRCV